MGKFTIKYFLIFYLRKIELINTLISQIIITFDVEKRIDMNWTTPIAIKEEKGYLHHGSPMLFMGSCFADNVGLYLSEARMDIEINPFGTLYNPESLAMALSRLMRGDEYKACELCNSGELWYSYHHHGKYSRSTIDATLQCINIDFVRARNMLPRCERLIVTMGTAYVYRLKSNGAVVTNCHKQPAALFTRERLTVEAIVNQWNELLDALFVYSPQCQVLFTVSPIRHLSDGAHDNQLSKSTLLLAVDELCRRFPDKCRYFPAYEIMMDELRDYRFYAEDMTHPTPQAVNYICERLAAAYFTDETQTIVDKCRKVQRSLQHRPLNGVESKSYKQFVAHLLQQIEQIEQIHTCLCYEREKIELKKIIADTDEL